MSVKIPVTGMRYCLRDPLKLVICINNLYDNNLGIRNYFTNYLKESCR